MAIYFHHVGLEGALNDFTKTIYTKVPVQTIRRFLTNQNLAIQNNIYRHIESRNLTEVNCWGVPSGAEPIIRSLSDGDYVVLIDYLKLDYMILCEVISYYHHQFPALSKHLWGTNKYPYIFFVEPAFLMLSWQELCGMLRYSDDYNPRGLFMHISGRALEPFNTVLSFIDALEVYTKPINQTNI